MIIHFINISKALYVSDTCFKDFQCENHKLTYIWTKIMQGNVLGD